MRISRLRAVNIKGFTDFEVDCADVNICAGINGSNKTSTITLITALFGNLGGKGNSRILRAGADSGEISATIESDDGGETWDYSREFNPGKIGPPVVRSSVTGKLGSPAEWLRPLIDKVSIEPISRAMNASEEEQTEILLSTIPMAVDQTDLETAAAGVDVPGLAAHLKNAQRLSSGLDAIAAVHKAIYDERTNVNRDCKTKTTHATELLDSIPKRVEGEDVNWQSRTAELHEEKIRKTREEADESREVERLCSAEFSSVSDMRARLEEEIDREVDDQIKALEQKRASRKSEVSTDAQRQWKKVTADKEERLTSIQKAYRPIMESLSAQHAESQRNWMEQGQHDSTRAIAARSARESGILKSKSEAMTVALDRLDNLKMSLLGRLDKEVPGMRVESGIISIDGVPLSEKNTAERVKFWLMIGARRAGELGVCCADGLECLDDFEFEKVSRAMLRTGLQWFLGRVDSKPFRVERINAAVEDGEPVPASV